MKRSLLLLFAMLAACRGDAVDPDPIKLEPEWQFTSRANDINDRGQIVGSSSLLVSRDDTLRLETHGFLWMSGKMHDLGTLGGDFSEAIAISEAGTILGRSTTPEGLTHPVLWIDGEIVDLLPDHRFSAMPTDFNGQGQVVGTFGPRRYETGFVWDAGVVTNLATLGGDRSSATGINELGQVVGYSENGAGDRIPFVWSDGVMQTLPLLGGTSSAQPLDINDAGRIIGQSGDIAVVWDATRIRTVGLAPHSTTVVDLNESGDVVGHLNTGLEIQSFVFGSGGVRFLGSLGGSVTEAMAINEDGLVVGMASTATADQGLIAFLWQDGHISPLTDIGGTQMTVQAVNGHGQVVGLRTTPTGDHRALLWFQGFALDLGTLGEAAVLQ
jgi:probable HAF family extracellular repeat protein